MARSVKPGGNAGRDGGVYQEVGPRGGKVPNFATIPDGHRAPPTTKPGHRWVQTERTPDSKRK